jgi:hypothetical protein
MSKTKRGFYVEMDRKIRGWFWENMLLKLHVAAWETGCHVVKPVLLSESKWQFLSPIRIYKFKVVGPLANIKKFEKKLERRLI